MILAQVKQQLTIYINYKIQFHSQDDIIVINSKNS